MCSAGHGDGRRLIHKGLERGGGRLKAIIYTAILLMLVYAAFKIVPAYVANYQLADKMQEVARFAVVNRFNEDQIREEIYKTMQDLGIPADRSAIKVVAGRSLVSISLNYTVPVDLSVYHLDLHFSPSSENKSLF